MRYLITGAGQIGSQLARTLTSDGHEVVILRRNAGKVDLTAEGATVFVGDAADRDVVRALASDASAIFHCIHAPYSASVWQRELPAREAAVMDIAAEIDIPVVFPESVYAFGAGARDLGEDTPVLPASPLGEVRAELLAARAAHPARTASVIASDLFGPTATPQASVILGTVLAPAAAGKRAWVMGDPDAPHAVTYIPDLAHAMVAAAGLANAGDALLTAPTAAAISQRQMAVDAAKISDQDPAGVIQIPSAAFALGAPFSPTMRELFRQRYLWEAPSLLRPGRLTTELGLQPTTWKDVLAEWAQGARNDRAATP